MVRAPLGEIRLTDLVVLLACSTDAANAMCREEAAHESWRCQHQKGLIFSTHSGNQVEVRMIATTRVFYTYMQGFNPRSAMWCLKVDPLTPSINCFIRALLSKSSLRLRPRP